MKVHSISNSNYKNAPRFKTCIRSYKSAASDIHAKQIIRTSTNFFREDINWKFLLKYLMFTFMQTNKVNTYSLASSDGSEAYTLALYLMSRLPEQYCKKFLPIVAVDIDSEIINSAKNRRININEFEFAYAKKLYHVDMHDYFINPDKPVNIANDDMDASEYNKILSYEPIDELKQAVQFKQSDILTELSQIEDDGNSIVMCRNVLPYLKEEYIDKVIDTAKNNLKTGSLFITGEYDSCSNVSKRLLDNGFYRPVLEYYNIFQKRY